MADVGLFDELLIPRRAILLADEIEDELWEHVSPILMLPGDFQLPGSFISTHSDTINDMNISFLRSCRESKKV